VAGLDAAACAVGAHAVSRASFERELRGYCVAALWRYLDRWWRPANGFACCYSCYWLAMVTGAKPDSMIDAVASALCGISLCGIVVAAISNFIRERWRTGVVNLLSLPLCLMLCVWSLFLMVVLDLVPRHR
jgi:hypothetical protein